MQAWLKIGASILWSTEESTTSHLILLLKLLKNWSYVSGEDSDLSLQWEINFRPHKSQKRSWKALIKFCEWYQDEWKCPLDFSYFKCFSLQSLRDFVFGKREWNIHWSNVPRFTNTHFESRGFLFFFVLQRQCIKLVSVHFECWL